MFHYLRIPAMTAAATIPFFTPVVNAESESKDTKDRLIKSRKIRPSELPIYETPEEVFNFEYQGHERCALEDGVSVVRKELESVIESTRSVKEEICHVYNTGAAHTSETWAYLHDDENILPRVGVITVGGLTGLLLAAVRRGGMVKRLLYSSAGVAGTSSLCYPTQATQVAQELINNGQVYGTIAYNFVAGVKPQFNGNGAAKEQEETKPENDPIPAAPEPDTSVEIIKSDEEVIKSVEEVLPSEVNTAPIETEKKIEGDIGQSNPEDTDMYTTRDD